MKKIILSLVALFVALNVNAQLLYKISGKDLTKPSYILGTQHLASAAFVDSIPGLRDAFAATEQVYGEIDLLQAEKPAQQQLMAAAMTLPEGTTLQSLLTAEQLERLNAHLRTAIGADLSNPMVAAQFGKLKPGALLVNLTLLMAMRHVKGFNPQDTFDDYFQKEARKNGKVVGGLETMEHQIYVLFESTPLDRQVEQLMCFVDNSEKQEAQLLRIFKAFSEQNLEELHAAIEHKMNNRCDMTVEEHARLLDNRNEAWVVQMPTLMKEKSTFFAVGAGHLLGEKGVLPLLRKAGYTITPIQ